LLIYSLAAAARRIGRSAAPPVGAVPPVQTQHAVLHLIPPGASSLASQ